MYADSQERDAKARTAEQRPAMPPDEQLRLVAEMFRMLADPTRVGILCALTSGEHSVTELAAAVGRPAASTSQHLQKLRLSGLVTTRREGTAVYYSCVSEHVARLVTDALHNAEHHEPGVPAHHRTDPGLAALPDVAEGGR